MQMHMQDLLWPQHSLQLCTFRAQSRRRRSPCLASSLSRMCCWWVDNAVHCSCYPEPESVWEGGTSGKRGLRPNRKWRADVQQWGSPCQLPNGSGTDPGSLRHFHGLGRVCMHVCPTPPGDHLWPSPLLLAVVLVSRGGRSFLQAEEGRGRKPPETRPLQGWAWGHSCAAFLPPAVKEVVQVFRRWETRWWQWGFQLLGDAQAVCGWVNRETGGEGGGLARGTGTKTRAPFCWQVTP